MKAMNINKSDLSDVAEIALLGYKASHTYYCRSLVPSSQIDIFVSMTFEMPSPGVGHLERVSREEAESAVSSFPGPAEESILSSNALSIHYCTPPPPSPVTGSEKRE